MIAKAEDVRKTEYKKFMFDTDFDDLPSYDEVQSGKRLVSSKGKDGSQEDDAQIAEPEPEPEAPSFTEEELRHAREQGLAEGREQGIAEAAEATEKQIGDGLDTMIKQVDILFEAQAQANHELAANAVAIAAALVRKLFPTLNKQTAIDQVEAMVRNAVTQLGNSSEILVRVPSDMAEAIHDRITAMTSITGLQGDLKVVGDADLVVGDCRLEWARGGVKRSAEELAHDLDEIIERNLANPEAPETTDLAMDPESLATGAEMISDTSAATDDGTQPTDQTDQSVQAETDESAASEINAQDDTSEPADPPPSPETDDDGGLAPQDGAEPALEFDATADAQTTDHQEDSAPADTSELTEGLSSTEPGPADLPITEEKDNVADLQADDPLDTDAVWAGLSGDEESEPTDGDDEGDKALKAADPGDEPNTSDPET